MLINQKKIVKYMVAINYILNTLTKHLQKIVLKIKNSMLRHFKVSRTIISILVCCIKESKKEQSCWIEFFIREDYITAKTPKIYNSLRIINLFCYRWNKTKKIINVKNRWFKHEIEVFLFSYIEKLNMRFWIIIFLANEFWVFLDFA